MRCHATTGRRRAQLGVVSMLALAAIPAGARPPSLGSFLPAKLAGASRTAKRDPTGGVIYRLPDRHVFTVDIAWVQDLGWEKLKFFVRKPGQKREVPNSELVEEGFDIRGTFVARTYLYPSKNGRRPPRSDARALIADRIIVTISDDDPRDPDDVVGWIGKLDLEGLTAFARSGKGPRAPAGGEASLRKGVKVGEAFGAGGRGAGPPADR